MNWDLSRRLDTEFHLARSDLENGQANVIADDNDLAELARQNEHLRFPPCALR